MFLLCTHSPHLHHVIDKTSWFFASLLWIQASLGWGIFHFISQMRVSQMTTQIAIETLLFPSLAPRHNKCLLINVCVLPAASRHLYTMQNRFWKMKLLEKHFSIVFVSIFASSLRIGYISGKKTSHSILSTKLSFLCWFLLPSLPRLCSGDTPKYMHQSENGVCANEQFFATNYKHAKYFTSKRERERDLMAAKKAPIRNANSRERRTERR